MKIRILALLFVVMLMGVGVGSADFVPETVNISLDRDTRVNEYIPDFNYGSNETLHATRSSSTKSYLYLTFTIPTYVTNASLNFYVSDGHPYLDESNTSFKMIGSNWNESTTTWNTDRPTPDVEDSVTYSTTMVLDKPMWHSLDLNELGVNVSGAGTYTVAINPQYGYSLTIHSKENEVNAPYVTYTTGETYDVRYVDPENVNSSNLNNGTSFDYPLYTISHALLTANKGADIYIKGDCNESVVISGDDFNFIPVDNPSITSSANTITFRDANNITFSGFNISSTGGNGILFDSSSGSNITLENNIINATSQSILFGASSQLSNSLIYDNYLRSSAATTVYFNSNSEVNNVEIVNNTIISDYSHGAFFSSNSGQFINMSYNYFSAAGNGVLSASQTSGTLTNNVDFTYNTIYASNDMSDTGSGIFIRDVENWNITYNHVLHARYTAVKTTMVRNSTISHNVVHPNGYRHNAFETKGSYSHYYNNTVLGHNSTAPNPSGASWHVWYGAGTQQERYNLIENSISYNTTSRLIMTGAGQSNFILRNIHADNHNGDGIFINSMNEASAFDRTSSNYTIFDNITINFHPDSTDLPIYALNLGTYDSETATGISDYANYTRDTVTLIDMNINHSNNGNIIYMYDEFSPNNNMMADVYFINPSRNSTSWDIRNPDYCDAVVHTLYYLNARVINNDGEPVSDAVITFTANTTNPETGTILKPLNTDYGDVYKAHVDELDSVLTNSLGFVPNRANDDSQTVALTRKMDYNSPSSYSSKFTEYVEWNITATKDGQSTSATITPDMLKYSPDSSIIQSDEVIFVLDVEGSGTPVTPSTPSFDHDTAGMYKTAVGMIGAVILIIFIAIPLTVVMKLRDGEGVSGSHMEKMVIATILLFALIIVLTVATKVADIMSTAMP